MDNVRPEDILWFLLLGNNRITRISTLLLALSSFFWNPTKKIFLGLKNPNNKLRNSFSLRFIFIFIWWQRAGVVRFNKFRKSCCQPNKAFNIFSYILESKQWGNGGRIFNLLYHRRPFHRPPRRTRVPENALC